MDSSRLNNRPIARPPQGEIPATGKKVRFSGVAIDRVVKGKIVEEWVYFNAPDFLLQRGSSVVPPKPLVLK
jgi:hypothetical protein